MADSNETGNLRMSYNFGCYFGEPHQLGEPEEIKVKKMIGDTSKKALVIQTRALHFLELDVDDDRLDRDSRWEIKLLTKKRRCRTKGAEYWCFLWCSFPPILMLAEDDVVSFSKENKTYVLGPGDSKKCVFTIEPLTTFPECEKCNVVRLHISYYPGWKDEPEILQIPLYLDV
jgi:hypothetical protein